jgi:hypothetical protein
MTVLWLLFFMVGTKADFAPSTKGPSGAGYLSTAA